ncbi:hypothetical protein WJX81_007601 [Elliptochloris bilobata]|uniref:PH domain-containing protein n=1 Tax=Elliptochloris bilobata TaxID=381761 RepID=A0AAW1RLN6_9CHLO
MQIVVGVLVKYVNIGKGWHHRLFVLQNGVLRYYKVFGPTRVNVHALLESLRQQGDVVLIGSETGISENKWIRSAAQQAKDGSCLSPTARGGAGKPATPQGEYHLQVAKVSESDADYRKFYLETGTTTMRLRAETKADRNAWVAYLTAAKGAWGDVTPEVAQALTSPAESSARITSGDNAFLEELEAVRARLAERGASAEVVAYVEDVLVTQHQRYHAWMAAEADKRRTLLGLVRSLENEKRQLETAMVVESTLVNKARCGNAIGSRHSLEAGEGGDSEVNSEQSDADADPSIEEGGAGAREDSSDDDAVDDARYYDARELQRPSLTQSDDLDAAGMAADGQLDRDSGDMPQWLREEMPPPKRRERLPPPAQQERSVSLWAIIRECVGKDLTRVCLPVYFNEPLSALQKLAEDLEYSNLLDQAAAEPPGSEFRIMLIAAFAVSGYSGTAGRTSKPFNPLLGETYELICAEKGFRMLAEKVCHHPTIIAACSEGRRWKLEGDAELKSKFWGRSIELTPHGLLRLTFCDGDEYTWSKVVTSINNLIIGRIYVDHGGVMRIRNAATGLTCKLRFREHSFLRSHNEHEVRGHLERNGERVAGLALYGRWDEAMYAELPGGAQRLLWQKNPAPPEPTRYNLTGWAIQLNELTPGLEERLAPTDCRLRPDQHCLELGQYDQANVEKQRLEQKQRAARKAADRGEPIRPRWFHAVPGAVAGEQQTFVYSGGYWEARAAREWPIVRDIFGQDMNGPEGLGSPQQSLGSPMGKQG